MKKYLILAMLFATWLAWLLEPNIFFPKRHPSIPGGGYYGDSGH